MLVFTLSAALAGCWQPPRADVTVHREPGVIQEDIAVESIHDGLLQSLDPTARTVALLEPAQAVPQTYALASGDSLGQIKVGVRVRMTIEEKLTVYVAPAGAAVSGTDRVPTLGLDAKVLMIDRSYRLLTLLRADGRRETFKVAQNAKLSEMQPGDAVAVQSARVVAVQPRQ